MQVLADTWPLSLNEAAFRGVSSWTSRKRCSMGQSPLTLSGGALWESRWWVLPGAAFSLFTAWLGTRSSLDKSPPAFSLSPELPGYHTQKPNHLNTKWPRGWVQRSIAGRTSEVEEAGRTESLCLRFLFLPKQAGVFLAAVPVPGLRSKTAAGGT